MTQNFLDMEDFLQQNYLDRLFGLTTDLFVDDTDNDCSILGSGIGGGSKFDESNMPSLEELLQPGPTAGFKDDWMENLDIFTLLEDTNTNNNRCVFQQTSNCKNEPEPRKEGMKTFAFEQLKALLIGTQPFKIETELSTCLLPEIPTVISPVAEVPSMTLPHVPLNYPDGEFLLQYMEYQSINDNADNEIQPVISLDNGDVAEIKPSSSHPKELCLNLKNQIKLVQSELNCDHAYINSIIDESSVSSPSNCASLELSTIDTSYPSDSDDSRFDSSRSMSCTTLKAKNSRCRVQSSPYGIDSDFIPDKKVRKKVQNKNAATRYRVKKKIEKESLQEQENRLSNKNKELRGKVESLHREIEYMKELMNEIKKAKNSKI